MGEVKGAIGILEHEGRFLLVANWRTFEDGPRLCWDLPGGAVEPGESIEEACCREFREETGRRVVVRDLAFVVERFGFRGAPPAERTVFFFFHVEQQAVEGPPTDQKILAAEFRDLAEIQTICTQSYHREMLDWFAGDRRRRYYVTECRPGRRPPPA